MTKRNIGFVLGIVIALAVYYLLPGVELGDGVEFVGGRAVNAAGEVVLLTIGKKCLALSLLAVCWWATGVAQPGYTSMFMLVGMIVWGVKGPDVVFGLWTRPIPYLVVGGYLIAAAARDSGLGKRVAYLYALKFITGYRSLIIGSYVLGVILSVLVPHPWPRSFLLMGVLAVITKTANMSLKDTANVGVSVFVGSCAAAMIFLTGDSVTNMFAYEAGANAMTSGTAWALGGGAPLALSWLGWFKLMGVPGVIITIAYCILQLFLYKEEGNFQLDKEATAKMLAELGPLAGKELRCLIWILIAIVLWVTGGGLLHDIHPAWVAVGIAMIMSLPKVGDVLGPGSWGDVSLATLFFLTAALGIGSIGGATGMNAWVAAKVLPATVPSNPFMFSLMVTVVCMVLHMVLGSVLAILGICVPTFIAFTQGSSIAPIAVALIVFNAISLHFILPFHHMNVLVGVGEKQGGYGDKEIIRMGVPLTVIVLIFNVVILVPWFQMLGYM